jgi:X-X-X-Leu-X-X-Gly heptad repeat protein
MDFNDKDILKKLMEAVTKLAGNSQYSRPSANSGSSAEDALEKYQKFLVEETTLAGKYQKAFSNGLFRTLAGLPKTLNKVYDQIEADLRTNNDAINKIQKQTIESVKAHKLNNKEITKLALETGKISDDISKHSKAVGVNTALQKLSNEKLKNATEKHNAALSEQASLIKKRSEATHKMLKETLADELKKIGSVLKQSAADLKESSDDDAEIRRKISESANELRDSLDLISNSKIFDNLDKHDQDAIKDFIKSGSVEMTDAVVSAMKKFEEMSPAIQNTLKSLVNKSVEHIRTGVSDISSKLHRAGAMAVVSGKGILDSYRAQLSANLIESTPTSIMGYGMDAGEQADIIKGFAREIASISGTNNMSKAYNESVTLSDLHDTAKLYGLTGKAAQELALQSVRTVNQMGAGTSGTSTSTTAKALMQQMSSSAAYLQTDKAAFAQDTINELQSGIYDSEITRLRMQGKTGADLSKNMIQNITALKGNTVQLGFSNSYAQQLLQNSMNAKFGGLSELINRKVASGMGGQIIPNMLGGNVAKEKMDAFRKYQEGGGFSALKTPEEQTAYLQLTQDFATAYNKAYEASNNAPANSIEKREADSKLMALGAQIEILRARNIDMASPETMSAALRSGFVQESITNQTTKDFSPVVNVNKESVAAAGSIESFNNTMGVFEQRFLELSEWARGIANNPFGNLAGAAIGGIGSMVGSAVGTGLTMWLMGAGGVAATAAIGTVVAGALTITGIVAAVGLVAYSVDTIFDSFKTLLKWYGEDRTREEEERKRVAARYEASKAREASGQPAVLGDMYRKVFEEATGKTLTKDDDFSYDGKGRMTYNGEVVSDADRIKVENLAYSKQIAKTGNSDRLTGAPLEQRSRILREEEAAYRNWRTKEVTPVMPSGAQRTGGRGKALTPVAPMVNPTPTAVPSPISSSAPSTPTIAPQTSAIANTSGLTDVQASLVNSLASQGITDPNKVSNILAQVEGESKFVPKSENMNYSAQRLMEVFPSHFSSLADAQSVVDQGQEAIGNRVYGGRNGNAQNEGYKYRGRGFIQLSNKDNYEMFGKIIGEDLVNNPDLANDPVIASKIMAAYFKQRENTGKYDLTDINSTGKAVGYATGPKETAHRASIAEQFKSKLSLQSNVTGSINSNLANPANNPVTMWSMIANTLSTGNSALVSGIDKLNDGIQTNNKLTGITAANTNPELNRKPATENEQKPSYRAGNRQVAAT